MTDSFIRNKVFISYSHKDFIWLERINTQLKPLEESGIEIWSDEKIPSGSVWKKEIERSLRESRVAVFLISADFLASDFINNHEIPYLLSAEVKEGLTVLPVILRATAGWEDSPLSEFQALNSEPLAKLQPSVQEEIMVQLYKNIKTIFQHPILEPAYDSDFEKILSDRYRIKKTIGRGPISSVVLATDLQIEHDVAIKVLHDENYEEIFDESLRHGAKVSEHPNIVTIYGGWLKRKPHYYIRQYIEGKSLRELFFDNAKGFPLDFIQRVLSSVGKAICYAHEQGIHNLNVKPSNIIIHDPFGKHEAHFLCPSSGDVEIIQVEGGWSTIGRQALYLPPELYYSAHPVGKSPEIADQYRIGMLAYEMLIGSQDDYFEKRIQELKQNTVCAEQWALVTDYRRDCPNFLVNAVAKMISVSPRKRHIDLGKALLAIGSISPDIEIARDSYRRIIALPKEETDLFFSQFYNTFLEECEEARIKFEEHGFPHEISGQLWHHQHAQLKEAIVLLLAFTILNEQEEPTILNRIIRTHGHGEEGMKIPANAYNKFQDALVRTAINFDPAWKNETSSNKLLLKECWERAIERGISHLRSYAKV